jgi:hypothetical protein
MLKKDEKVLKNCGASLESKAEVVASRPVIGVGPIGLGSRHSSKTVNVKGDSGTIYLTNQRIIFVVTKGVFSKTTTITRNNALTDIENISVSGTLGKGLNIDWAGGAHDRYSGLDDPVAWESEIRAIISGQ